MGFNLTPIAAEEPTVLRVIMRAAMPSGMLDELEAYADANNINLDIELWPDGWVEFYEKMAIGSATGAVYDIVWVNVDLPVWGPRGVFADLTQYFERDAADLADLNPAAIDAFSASGKIYGMPAQLHTTTFVANVDLFDKMGIAISPSQDWSEADWTWDEFENAAQKLTVSTSDGTKSQWGIETILSYLAPRYWGESFTDAEGRVSRITHPTVIESFQRMADLHGVFDVVGGSFGAGTAAMSDIGTWRLSESPHWDFDWMLIRTPMGTQRAADLNPDGFAIGPHSPNKDVAWNLIKHIATDLDAATNYALAAGALPADRSAMLIALEEIQSLYPGARVDTLIGSFQHTRILNYWKNASNRQIYGMLLDAFSHVAAGHMSAQQVLTQIEPEIIALLDAGVLSDR